METPKYSLIFVSDTNNGEEGKLLGVATPIAAQMLNEKKSQWSKELTLGKEEFGKMYREWIATEKLAIAESSGDREPGCLAAQFWSENRYGPVDEETFIKNAKGPIKVIAVYLGDTLVF